MKKIALSPIFNLFIYSIIVLCFFLFLKCTKKVVKEMEQPATFINDIEEPQPTSDPKSMGVGENRIDLNESFEPIYFEFDKYTLNREALSELENISHKVLSLKDVSIRIDGYTCEIGSAEYNLALSQRRADEVKKYFENMGIFNIHTVGWGEEKPTGQELKYDRRAIITIEGK